MPTSASTYLTRNVKVKFTLKEGRLFCSSHSLQSNVKLTLPWLGILELGNGIYCI